MTDPDLVSLKAHVEALLHKQAEALDAAFRAHRDVHEAQQRAIDKADSQMETRLSGMNEFRDTLRDQASHFVDSKHLEGLTISAQARYDALLARVSALEQARSNLEGRMTMLGIGMTVLIALASLASRLL